MDDSRKKVANLRKIKDEYDSKFLLPLLCNIVKEKHEFDYDNAQSVSAINKIEPEFLDAMWGDEVAGSTVVHPHALPMKIHVRK